ncbi:MAG: thioredoxin domain-containing protein [bacterium]|nr:thioredoxin domain-containing protein [bacterium]
MKNISLLLGTIIGTLLLIGGIAVFFSKETTPTAQVADQAELVAGAKHTIGPDSAPVTIVEFSDLQCPACKASQPLVKAVVAEFGDQVRLVYRHFPLDQLHPLARTAAVASEIAAEENAFWPMHDLLFERQLVWSKLGSVDEAKATFTQYAVELGLDEAAFSAKIQDSSVYSSLVQKDADLGTKIGINATPTFFVNGQKATATQMRDLVAKAVQERSTAQ